MNLPVKKLGDYIETIMGQAPPSADCNKKGLGTPFVKAGEFGEERPIIREWTTKPLKLSKVEDVLLCVVGATCGKINKGADCAIGRSVAAIRANPTQLDNSYLYYFLSSWTSRLRAMSQGAAQTVINKDMIEGLAIPLPSLEEQKRIAAILDKADAIRRKRQETIKLADEFLRAVFLDMFGDPVTNPKIWNKKQLGELIKLSSGNGLTAKEMSSDGDYLVYGGNGINGKHSEFMFEKPQLIIGRVGVYCGVVHITKPFSWVTDNALYVKEYLQEIDVDFLAMLLEIMNLNQYAGQAAQPLISGGRIYPLEAILPPLDLQKKFSKIKARFNFTQNILNESYDRSEKCFLSLSQKSFSGGL